MNFQNKILAIYIDKTQIDFSFFLPFEYCLQFNAIGNVKKWYKWNLSIEFYKLKEYEE